ERVRVIKETTTVTNTVTQPVPAPAPAAPPPNRSPNVTASCNPCSVEPGQTTNLTATGTDPDGDPLTFTWTAPAGTCNNPNAAHSYLVTRGIAMGRLRTVSYGEERPIADNNTAEGRALNRRVHLAVIIQ